LERAGWASLAGRAAGWAVHGLTAFGAVLGLFALLAAADGALARAALLLLLALAVDGVDGALARRLRVGQRAPQLDGRRLDDIVDYLNYVVVPACFLWWAGVVEWPWLLAAPVLASAWGFGRSDAKVQRDGEHFFTGFPSCWNVAAIYLWQFQWSAAAAAALLLALSLLVFAPLRFVHPGRLRVLRWTTGLSALAWWLLLIAAICFPHAAARWRLLEISLLFPAWYLALSAWRGRWLGGLTGRAAREA